MTIEQTIVEKLSRGLQPSHLEVLNESHMHNVAPGSETHFKVVVVSPVFESLGKVKRHQQVYGLLGDELAGPVHALALHTYTEAEWGAMVGAPDSPACRGGSRHG